MIDYRQVIVKWLSTDGFIYQVTVYYYIDTQTLTVGETTKFEL